LPKKVLLVSRCAWTLYNFRAGQIRTLLEKDFLVIGGGAGGDGYEEKIRSLGIHFVPLPVDKKGTNPPADARLFWRLYRWYRMEKPDLVHHFTIKPVIYGSVAARLAGVPRIINTITGLGYVFIEKKSWLRKLVEWQYRLALSSAHYTFFQNREDRDLFIRDHLIHPDKAGLLAGSGVDIDFFSQEPINQIGAKDKRCTFLVLARLLKEKGIYEFVEAARLVKKQFPETRFELLGRRDERNPTVIPQEHIDAWQAEGLVRWLGETADVKPYIQQADVVVLPSYREGLPRSLLEASAMGKPLITTDVVGCRDVLDHEVTGLMVPVRDDKALAQAMLWMIDHPQARTKMGAAGRLKIVEEFDERKVIEKILAAYHLSMTKNRNNRKINR
jgi:glycosyltransferase involved in cell wall biosynthesis